MSYTTPHQEPSAHGIAVEYRDYCLACRNALVEIFDRADEVGGLQTWLSTISGDVPSMRDIMHDEPMSTVATFLNFDTKNESFLRLNREFHERFKQ